MKRFKTKGRPKKDQHPDSIDYQIEGNLSSLIEVRRKQIEMKCCFILATNELDETKLSDEQLFTYYTQDQQKV